MSPAELGHRCDPLYLPSRHQFYFSAVVANEIRKGGARVIVNMPPRHGKSRLFAVETPLWEMLRRPGCEVVSASYAVNLAEKHSRQARDRAEGNDIFKAVTSARIRPDFSAVNHWALTNGSSYKAIGVDGGLTGFGADLLILDDLHAGPQEAHSPTQRQAVWDWLQSVAMTRLSPGASVVLIGTRWHQDDVTGRLLAQDGKRWTQINLPALAGTNDELGRLPGEPLWPERFPSKALESIRQSVSNYFWQALYDGNPVADTGNHVDISKIRVVNEPCEDLRCVRFWDLAVTAKTSADYTVGAHCAVDRQGNLWILDICRGQMEWPRARDIICQRAQIDRCEVGVEAVGTQGGLAQNLREVFPSTFSLREITPEKDKLTRALPWFSRVNKGQCFMLRGAWNSAFLDECQAFPLGAHDDQVDAVSGAYGLLFGAHVGTPGMPESNRVAKVNTARRERAVLL